MNGESETGMTRQTISSGSPWEEIAGYSRAVRVGQQVFVAGTTAVKSDGSVDSTDAYAQSAETLRKILAALAEAGARPEDVVRTRMFITDIADAGAVCRAHAEVFGDIRPAATLVEVKGLMTSDLKVEIEADAVIQDQI